MDPHISLAAVVAVVPPLAVCAVLIL